MRRSIAETELDPTLVVKFHRLVLTEFMHLCSELKEIE